ncbi:MAG: helix-turn-helix domain-containing protein [Candidatus Omnitrophota bacterium]
MTKLKTINSEALLEEQLKSENFRVEYEALEEEFELAKEIIRLRKEAGLTQQQLAQKAGTSQPSIARLESGEYKNLTLTFLRKIGNALGVIPEIHFKKFRNAH